MTAPVERAPLAHDHENEPQLTGTPRRPPAEHDRRGDREGQEHARDVDGPEQHEALAVPAARGD